MRADSTDARAMVAGAVMVLDDDALQRRAWSRWLRRAGVSHEVVADVESARRLLARRRFVLLVADYQLAHGTSLALLRELAQLESIPHVLVLTGAPDLARRELGEGWHVLAKPILPAEVLRAARECLRA